MKRVTKLPVYWVISSPTLKKFFWALQDSKFLTDITINWALNLYTCPIFLAGGFLHKLSRKIIICAKRVTKLDVSTVCTVVHGERILSLCTKPGKMFKKPSLELLSVTGI